MRPSYYNGLNYEQKGEISRFGIKTVKLPAMRCEWAPSAPLWIR